MRSLLLAAAASLLAACAPSAPKVEVRDAWARATAPGQSSAAIYATIANAGAADRLVGVDTVAGMAMLHSSDTVDGVARMRMLGEMPVPAKGQATLAPGGTHVMVTGLKAPLAAGSTIDATFRFAASGAQSVKVAIVAPGTR